MKGKSFPRNVQFFSSDSLILAASTSQFSRNIIIPNIFPKHAKSNYDNKISAQWLEKFRSKSKESFKTVYFFQNIFSQNVPLDTLECSFENPAEKFRLNLRNFLTQIPKKNLFWKFFQVFFLQIAPLET